MDKVFKRKNEIPPPPSIPTSEQILEDLEAAGSDDPAFFESSINMDNTREDDSYRMAKDFITSITKLKEMEKVLSDQKTQLENSNRELQVMMDNIRQEATDALSNVY